MPFLKNLGQRLDEPFRPTGPGTPPEEPKVAEPVAVAPTEAAKASFPEMGPAKAIPGGTIQPDIRLSDMLSFVASSPDTVKRVIRDSADEVTKVPFEASRAAREGTAGAADIDAVDALDYFIGAAEQKEGDVAPPRASLALTKQLAERPGTTNEAVLSELEKQGRQAKVVRTRDDVVADVIADQAKKYLFDQAKAAGAENKEAKAKSRAQYDAVLQQVIDASEDVETQRQAEMLLSEMVSQRMSPRADVGARQLHAISRRAAEEAQKEMSPDFWKSLYDFPAVPIAAAERVLGENVRRATERTLPEIRSEDFVNRIFTDAIRRGEIVPGTKVSFEDVKQQSRPAPSAIAAADLKSVQDAATAAGIDPAVLYSITQTESAGNPRAIAFNPHKTGLSDERLKELGVRNPENRSGLFKAEAVDAFGKLWAAGERDAAVKATAFGLGQVMGSWLLPSYKTPEALLRDFEADPEGFSYKAMALWFSGNPKAKEAAKAGQWDELATRYYGKPSTQSQQDQHDAWVQRFKQHYAAQREAYSTEAPESEQEEPFAESSVEEPQAETTKPISLGEYAREATAEELQAERETGLSLQRAQGAELADPSSWVQAVAGDITELPYLPSVDSANYNLAKNTIFETEKNEPRVFNAIMAASEEGLGTGFDKIRRAVYEAELEDVDYESMTPEEKAEFERRVKTKAFRYVAHSQTARLITTPLLVDFEDLVGESQSWMDLPGVPKQMFKALDTKIEVLGSNGDEIIYRAEPALLAWMNSLDALPLYGQGFNVGLLRNYWGPRLRGDKDFIDTSNGVATGMASFLVDFLPDLYEAGVKGVKERDNVADGLMDLAAFSAQAVAETAVGEGALNYLADEDLLPFTPEGMAPMSRRLASKDVARSMGRMAAMPAGLAGAMLHPDAISAVTSAGKGLKTFRRVSQVVAQGSESSRLLGHRKAIYTSGLTRQAATLTAARTMEHGSPEEVLNLLDDLERVDANDAGLRAIADVAAREVDIGAGEILAGMATDGHAGALDSVDLELSKQVRKVIDDAIEIAKQSDDPDIKAHGADLEKLVKELGLGDYITLTPGAVDAATEDAKVASQSFDTSRRLRAILMAGDIMEAAGPQARMKTSILKDRLIRPFETLGDMAASDIGVGNLNKALDSFGPIEPSALPDALKGLTDKGKEAVKASHKALSEWHADFRAALETGDIFKPEVYGPLKARYKSGGFHVLSKRIFANTPNGRNGKAYKHTVDAIFDQVDAVGKASSPNDRLQRGVAAIMTSSTARGRALLALAESLTDADEVARMGLTMEEFLSNPKAYRLKRFINAFSVGSREALEHTIVAIGLRKGEHTIAAEAKARQAKADGTDTQGVTFAIQRDQVRRALARAEALEAAGDVAEAERHRQAAEALSQPEWRHRLIQSIVNAIENGEAAEAVFDLPYATDLGVLVGKGKNLTVSKATRKFAKDLFGGAYGKVDEVDGKPVKMTNKQKNLMALALEHLLRQTAGVSSIDNPTQVNKKIAAWLDANIHSVQRPTRLGEKALQAKVDKAFAERAAEVFEKETGKNIEAAGAEVEALRREVEGIQDPISPRFIIQRLEDLLETADSAFVGPLKETIETLRGLDPDAELAFSGPLSERLIGLSRTNDKLKSFRGSGVSAETAERSVNAPGEFSSAVETLRALPALVSDALDARQNEVATLPQKLEALKKAEEAYYAGVSLALYKTVPLMDEETIQQILGAQRAEVMAVLRRGEETAEPSVLFQKADTAGAETEEAAEAQRMWKEQGTDSPYFKRWFGDSKVVDSNGGPLVVYHGTTKDFEQFRRGDAGYFGGGIYFSQSPEAAGAFVTPVPEAESQSVVPAYLSMKNPFYVRRYTVPEALGNEIEQILRNNGFSGPLLDRFSKSRKSQFRDPGAGVQLLDVYRGLDPHSSALALDGADIFERRKKAASTQNQINAAMRRHGFDGIIHTRPEIEYGGYAGAPEWLDFGTEYVVFDPEQVKSPFNRGTFSTTSPKVLFQKAERIGGTPKAAAQTVVDEAEAGKAEMAARLRGAFDRLQTIDRSEVEALSTEMYRLESDLRPSAGSAVYGWPAKPEQVAAYLDSDLGSPLFNHVLRMDSASLSKEQKTALWSLLWAENMRRQPSLRLVDHVLMWYGSDTPLDLTSLSELDAKDWWLHGQIKAVRKEQAAIAEAITPEIQHLVPQAIIDQWLPSPNALLHDALMNALYRAQSATTEEAYAEALTEAKKIRSRFEAPKKTERFDERGMGAAKDFSEAPKRPGEVADVGGGEAVTAAEKYGDILDLVSPQATRPADAPVAPAAVDDTKRWFDSAAEGPRGRASILRKTLRFRDKVGKAWGLDSGVATIPDYDYEVLKEFVSMVGTERLADVAFAIEPKISEGLLMSGEPYGLFLFGQDVVGISHSAIADGKFIDTTVHELWHALSQRLPDDTVQGLHKQYLDEREAFMKQNPGAFDADGNLTDIARAKGQNTYRYEQFDEWVVEKMKDLSIAEATQRVERKAKDASDAPWKRALRALAALVIGHYEQAKAVLGKDVARQTYTNFMAGKYMDKVRSDTLASAVKLTEAERAAIAKRWTDFLDSMDEHRIAKGETAAAMGAEAEGFVEKMMEGARYGLPGVKPTDVVEPKNVAPKVLFQKADKVSEDYVVKAANALAGESSPNIPKVRKAVGGSYAEARQALSRLVDSGYLQADEAGNLSWTKQPTADMDVAELTEQMPVMEAEVRAVADAMVEALYGLPVRAERDLGGFREAGTVPDVARDAATRPDDLRDVTKVREPTKTVRRPDLPEEVAETKPLISPEDEIEVTGPAEPTKPRDPMRDVATESYPQAKGAVEFLEDARAIMYAFQDADASTGLHELSHVLRRHLSAAHRATTIDWMNSVLRERGIEGSVRFDEAGALVGDNGKAVVEAEEAFASAFEKYMRVGDTPIASLADAFEFIKSFMKKIYDSIVGTHLEVSISDEMYKVFDEMYGADSRVRMKNLSDIEIYLTHQETLGARPLRVGASTEAGAIQEARLVDRFHQFLAEPPTSGLGATRQRSKRIGAVSARGRSLEDIGAEAMGKGEYSKMKAAAYRAADQVVEIGKAVPRNIAWATLFGDDQMRLWRTVPPEMRVLQQGFARQLGEYLSEMSQMVVDVNRRTGRDREAGIVTLTRFMQGDNVRFKTGAQRGKHARENAVRTGDAFLRMLSNFVDRVADDAAEILLKDAESVLQSWAEGAPPMDTKGALTGFWKGYAVRQSGAKVTVEGLESGLYIADEVVEGVKHTRANIKVDDMTSDTLGNIFFGFTGQPLGKDTIVRPEAQRLAALLLFLTGKTELRSGDAVFTAADLGDVNILEALYTGTTMTKRGPDGAEVSLRLPGMMDLPVDVEKNVGALAALSVAGFTSAMYSDMVHLGLGVSGSDVRAFNRWFSGETATMSAGDIALAKKIAREFGLRPDFTASLDSVGAYYIPTNVRKTISDTIGGGLRQFGLKDKPDGNFDSAKAAMSQFMGYAMGTLIFGAMRIRQTYRMLVSADNFTNVGLAFGVKTAAAANARVSVMAALSSMNLLGGLVEPERVADFVDKGAKLVGADLPKVEFAKDELRKKVAAGGDVLGHKIGVACSEAKYRVEAGAIMENQDVYFVLGGRVFNSRDLRRVFTRSGLYSTAYKDVKSLIRSNAKMDPKRAIDEVEMASGQRKFLNSAVEVMRDMPAHLRGGGSTVFEHGIEAADAMAEVERTGLAVTLIEAGYNPVDAARMATEVLYDYRGSMGNTDRSLLRRMIMPFWAFRKNANIYAANALGSPAGIFRMTAIGRAYRFGPAALTSVIYEAMLSPYDVNTTALNSDQRDVYYSLRQYFEHGLGDNVRPERLAEYRAMLPEDKKSISDEELKQYSFNGWTIANGFGSYEQVPQTFKVAFRGLLAGSLATRSGGKLYSLAGTLHDADLMKEYVTKGHRLSVQPGQSTAGLPGWALARKPTIQIPLPVLTESIQEAMLSGGADSIYYVLPDVFITSVIDHAGATLATSYVMAQAAANPDKRDKAQWIAMLNAIEPITDMRDYSSPILTMAVEAGKAAAGDEPKRVRLHPLIARALEGSMGAALEQGGTEGNLVAWADPALSTMAGAAGGTTGDVDIERRRAAALPVEVTVEDGKRVVKPMTGVAEKMFGLKAEYITPDGRGAYTPYLRGPSAIYFPYMPLGQLNTAMLKADPTGAEMSLVAEKGEVNDVMMAFLTELARKGGVGVIESNPERNASIEAPRPVKP